MTTVKINYGNNFEMTGREAVLTKEVSFYTSIHSYTAYDKEYPVGTKIELSYYQEISDLYIFTFPCGRDFPIRSSKFKWKK